MCLCVHWSSSLSLIMIPLYLYFPNQFPYYPVLQLLRVITSCSIWNTSSVLKLWEDFWDAASWNSSCLAITHWFIFLAIFPIFILISFKIFSMILYVRIFYIVKKKSVLSWRNICILAVEHFSVLKHCISIGFCEVVKTFSHPFLDVVLHLSLSFRIPTTKYNG